MTPEPALRNSRSRCCASGGRPKKRRKPGSSKKGLRGAATVPLTPMFTTAGAARLITGANEGSAFCAKTGAESTKAALAARAAKSFFMEQNLGGARCLTGRESHKFQCVRGLFFRRASASVYKLCIFCGIFLHTRCGTAQKSPPDGALPHTRPEKA